MAGLFYFLFLLNLHCCSIAQELLTTEVQQNLVESSRMIASPMDDRRYAAVASMEGVLINQHLGEADRLLIYEKTDSEIRLLETREAPEPGLGKQRWLQMTQILKDCHSLLVSGVGKRPREVLEHDGIETFVTEGLITEELNLIFAGIKPRSICSRKSACGSDCSGSGFGCG